MIVNASDHCPKCNHTAVFHGNGRCYVAGCTCKETRESIKVLQRETAIKLRKKAIETTTFETLAETAD